MRLDGVYGGARIFYWDTMEEGRSRLICNIDHCGWRDVCVNRVLCLRVWPSGAPVLQAHSMVEPWIYIFNHTTYSYTGTHITEVLVYKYID